MNNDFLKIIGEIVAYGGGITAIIYGVLRLFGQKWLDHKFSQRIEEFKRFQNQEYEKYRFEINKLFNRVNKIHEKEFDVIPSAWQKLQLAHGSVAEITSPLQSYPDLNRMNNNELQDFLKKSKLYDYQKVELNQQKDKNEYYRKKIFWINYNEVAKYVMDFHNYILLNKIFFEKDMFDLFSDIDRKLSHSHLISADLIEEGRSRELWEDLRKSSKDLQPSIDNLELMIQKRLHLKDAV